MRFSEERIKNGGGRRVRGAQIKAEMDGTTHKK